jgi:hypothetical protein
MLLLLHCSLTERSMDPDGGWGAALAHHFARKVRMMLLYNTAAAAAAAAHCPSCGIWQCISLTVCCLQRDGHPHQVTCFDSVWQVRSL